MTPQEAIVEFAGRTCYRSVDKMGHAPKFLHARMAEGHQDIFEHVWITAVLIDDDDSVNLIESHRYAWVTRTENGQWCYVSANMRVWLELARTILVARSVVARYLPGMFVGHQSELPSPSARVEMPERIVSGRATVNLIGIHHPQIQVGADVELHWAATFLLDGVSRALTHQLVRHRLLSFSQESQRYVSLDKGGWYPIVPSAIASKTQARQIVDETWRAIERGYEQLRELGIRKEDARYLLPNATSTTIMVSGSIAAWRDVFGQRCAPDAQWEIRDVANAMKSMLIDLGVYND
jgi:thymidylate synthase (FAD)